MYQILNPCQNKYCISKLVITGKVNLCNIYFDTNDKCKSRNWYYEKELSYSCLEPNGGEATISLME